MYEKIRATKWISVSQMPTLVGNGQWSTVVSSTGMNRQTGRQTQTHTQRHTYTQRHRHTHKHTHNDVADKSNFKKSELGHPSFSQGAPGLTKIHLYYILCIGVIFHLTVTCLVCYIPALCDMVIIVVI